MPRVFIICVSRAGSHPTHTFHGALAGAAVCGRAVLEGPQLGLVLGWGQRGRVPHRITEHQVGSDRKGHLVQPWQKPSLDKMAQHLVQPLRLMHSESHLFSLLVHPIFIRTNNNGIIRKMF